MSDHLDDAYETHAESIAQPAPTPIRRALSKDQILRAQDLQTEWLSVPEWGGDVRVRAMTAGQRDRLEASTFDGKGKPAPARMAEFRSRMVAMSVIDEDGNPLFDEHDIRALMNKSMLAIERVLKVVRRLSGLTEEEEADLLGNSEPAPSA